MKSLRLLTNLERLHLMNMAALNLTLLGQTIRSLTHLTELNMYVALRSGSNGV